MKTIYCFLLLCFCLSACAQKKSFLSTSYLAYSLSGQQMAIRTNYYPLSTPFGLDFVAGTNFNKNFTLKLGFTIEAYRNNHFSLNTGARVAHEYFFNRIFRSETVTYNVEFPLDFRLEISQHLFLTTGLIPTWNNYSFASNKIDVNFGFGLGYLF